MDFYRIAERPAKNGVTEIYPDFRVGRSKDLMIRGKSFYAIWDEEAGLWSTDEYDVQRLVDADLLRYKAELAQRSEGVVQCKFMGDWSSQVWIAFRSFVSHLSDSSSQLDESLTFANTDVKKSDHVSKRLPYALAEGDISAWDEIVGTLYDEENRAKIEWAIGAIVSGDSKWIQKFLVFYGPPGTGKSTIMGIIHDMFRPYTSTFDAKALTQSGNAFATEVFKSNPLVAIQHDGDLSKIEDNAKLNSIVAHELMTMNEKFKPSYDARVNAMLLMGTNKAVKITDAKSGIIRRLIDVQPTGETIPNRRYNTLMKQVEFELGAIAWHCLQVYLEMGKNYYSGYVPVEMMLQTDVFFNFIEAYYDIFAEQNGTTLAQAYEMYKVFCDESNVEYKLARYKFREELKNYFTSFEDRAVVDGERVRSWYSGFNADRFKAPAKEPKQNEPVTFSLVMEETESLLDQVLASYPAQYSTPSGTPKRKWTVTEEEIAQGYKAVDTVLTDIDTTKEHYVLTPENMVVIDFDLKDPNGEKSAELNLEKASVWPSTYAEFSKSGSGIHLHYYYDGPVEELSRVYDDGIEVKVFTGSSSLRRRLSRCNSVPIATLNRGALPLKEKKEVINNRVVQSERGLRAQVERNLRKEIHPATKPSMDFIKKILDDAYEQGVRYDLTDMMPRLMAFAANSSNQKTQCLKILQELHLKSDHADQPEETLEDTKAAPTQTDRLAYYDVEVFPNLFVVCWKFEGDINAFGVPNVVKMINPSPQQIEELLTLKLVGFNVRKYDNHILYARLMGFNNQRLYELSKRIISGDNNALFREAYNLSYADIFDYSSVKQSLKKFQIELGIPHLELGLPWDKPVPEELIPKVVEYCANDVVTTELVAESRKQDYIARLILADLSGLSVNASTQQHTSKIVFGKDPKPQEKFEYTDLSGLFPGYKFEAGKSYYRGEITGEGGYVYAEPGMYTDVALLDVASMHPTSIEQLNLFGSEYTKNYSAIKQARLAIKRGDYDSAKEMLGGKLARHLSNPDDAEALSYALKIVINIVYGLTSASFANAFRDPRNVDNIVAKRGALFMVDCKHKVQEDGYTVAHIKTDSIKIPNATKEIIEDVMLMGAEYGYEFEHEATYEKMCLVNDAVYIAKTKPGKKPAYWTAVGAQFQHPYVFKTLFSKEPITFDDLCETKQVTTALYLDFEGEETPMVLSGENVDTKHFIGKIGRFVPIKPGHGGGLLQREKEGEFSAATGTKGYRWLEAEMVKALHKEDAIDMSYFKKLADDAYDTLKKFADAGGYDMEWFLS